MFEVKCIVGDKKLIEVLHLLNGNTLEPPVVLPVKGAATAKTNGHAVVMPPTLSTTELLTSFVKPLKQVTPKQMREHLESNGFTKNGYSYALAKLIENGALKKSKAKGVYEVVR